MIVVLWRAGLRIQEALALAEHDLDHRCGSLLCAAGRAGADARSAWTFGTTSIYLQGIDPEQIIMAVRTRRAPMMSASAGLRL